MLVIRSIQLEDLDALIAMAHQVGSGMTSVKPNVVRPALPGD